MNTDSTQREKVAAGKRAEKKRRQRKFRAAARLLLVLLVVAGVCFSLYAVCKIKKISVNGNKLYTQSEITEASGIKLGGSMFLISSGSIQSALYEKLSYVEEAVVTKRFPYSIDIEITEVGENCAIKLTNGYAVVSKTLKVLSESRAAGSMPVITGVEVTKSRVGSKLESDDADKLTYLERLLTLLSDEGLLEKVNDIDVSDTLNISLLYDSRISVMIGTAANLDYKIAMLKEVVVDKLYPGDEGQLNLSTAGKATFSPAHEPETDEAVEKGTEEAETSAQSEEISETSGNGT